MGLALFASILACVGLVFFFKTESMGERLPAAGACGALVMVAIVFWVVWYDGDGTDDLGRVELPDWALEALPFVAAYGGAIGVAVGGIWIAVIAAIKRTPSVVSEISQVARSRSAEQSDREDAVYSEISDELDSGRIDRATWLKAYERVNGDEQRARAEYIRLRKKKLLHL